LRWSGGRLYCGYIDGVQVCPWWKYPEQHPSHEPDSTADDQYYGHTDKVGQGSGNEGTQHCSDIHQRRVSGNEGTPPPRRNHFQENTCVCDAEASIIQRVGEAANWQDLLDTD
jgi:hypothetical protein